MREICNAHQSCPPDSVTVYMYLYVVRMCITASMAPLTVLHRHLTWMDYMYIPTCIDYVWSFATMHARLGYSLLCENPLVNLYAVHTYMYICTCVCLFTLQVHVAKYTASYLLIIYTCRSDFVTVTWTRHVVSMWPVVSSLSTIRLRATPGPTWCWGMPVRTSALGGTSLEPL